MLKIKNIEGIIIAKFEGVTRFNSIVSAEVKEELSEILQINGAKLIFDLEGIKFIDSSAFGVLISLIKLCKQSNATIKFCNASQEVSELINVMQLDSVFTICTDLDSCINSF